MSEQWGQFLEVYKLVVAVRSGVSEIGTSKARYPVSRRFSQFGLTLLGLIYRLGIPAEGSIMLRQSESK